MAECHCFARRVKRFGAEDQKRDIGKRCISKGWLLCMGLFSSFYRSGLRRVRPFDKSLKSCFSGMAEAARGFNLRNFFPACALSRHD
jgi:hypothetical protein